MRARYMLPFCMVALAVTPAAAQPPRSKPTPRPDLADTAAGTYYGDVISDARGSGRQGVTITVVKTGPNTVSVSSDYPRLPTFTARLGRYMETIQKTTGPEVFLLELSKSPRRLGVTDDDASWTGTPAQ